MSQIRRLISEIVELTLKDLEQELSEFEKGNLRDALNKSSIISRSVNVDDIIEDPSNYEQWKSILSHGTIKYLGSGRLGSAFSLGDNLVLKLEKGRPRASEIEDALYTGVESGAGLPKILDTGILNSAIGPIGWSIVEKLQDAGNLADDPEWNIVWKAISNGIKDIVASEVKASKAATKLSKKMKPDDSPMSQVKSFSERNPEELSTKLEELLPVSEAMAVEERYRLRPDWLKRFVAGLLAHYRLGMVDFKPDNMGIRRVGPMGEIVFFDAASAKLRNKKMWEP
jgi:hypothetical protein